MAVRRGVAGVLAALLLVLIVTSSLATVLTLTGRSLEYSREALESSAERARDIAVPPALSLEAPGGSLVATVISQSPTEVRWFVVERADGSVEVKPGGRVHGATRFTLSTSYNCQPVRVYMMLSSGATVAYDPRNDPLVARMPEGWDGWWTCGLVEGTGGGSGGTYDPKVWLKTTGLGDSGGNNIITIPVNWQGGVSTQVRVGTGSVAGRCSILDPATRHQHPQQWYPEVVVGSFTVQGSRVDVVLGCTQGWPIALYLALRGPEDTVFSGRVDFNYSVTFRAYRGSAGTSPDPSLNGPLPVAYTPIGTSTYNATSAVYHSTWPTMWSYRGSAIMNYRMSTIMVLLVWAYMAPVAGISPNDLFAYLTIGVGIRVNNATRVDLKPASLDLGVADTVRVRLYRYNLTLDPFSHAIYRVYQSFLPGTPRVYLVASVNGAEFRRPVEPGKVVEFAFPGARFRLEVTPHVHPPLFNGINTSHRVAFRGEGIEVSNLNGRTHPAPSLSPWRGPVLVEIETPKSKFLAALSWPGVLAVTQLGTTYRGYAQLIADHPFTVTPDEMVRIARVRVDGRTLVVAVEQTVFANPPPARPPDLRSYIGTHIVMTVVSRNPYISESIIAWVS